MDDSPIMIHNLIERVLHKRNKHKWIGQVSVYALLTS